MKDFKVPNKNFKQVVQDIFDNQPFMQYLNSSLDKIKPGIAEISVPFSSELTQQHSYFHAGVMTTLADNSAGLASATLLPEGAGILTAEFKMNILRPGKGEKLVAVGQVIKPGRTLCVAKSDVYAIDNDNKTHCCTFLGTMMFLLNNTRV